METKKQRDIQSRDTGLTRDVEPVKARERTFSFPKLGVTAKAENYQEALAKAKEAFKNNK